MPSFLPLPWSPNPDDHALTLRAEAVLHHGMGIRVHPPLELLPGKDSLSESRLWRLGFEFILKSSPATAFHLQTAALARDLLLACQGIAGIPRLIHKGPPLVEAGRVWMLLEMLTGEPWNPWCSHVAAMHEEANALLKSLHDRSRAVLGGRQGPFPCFSIRCEGLKRLGELAPLLAKKGGQGGLEQRVAFRLLARQRDYEQAMACLPASGSMVVIHGDPRPANWIFKGGVLAGLIDYGACRWDHPLSDFGRLASGLPGAVIEDETTLLLARTNRWGAMTRWCAKVVESGAPWDVSEQHRVEELLRLDEADA